MEFHLKDAISPEPGSVLWTIITFLIIVWLIGRFGWKPILSGLRAREETIRKDLDTAKSEREKAQAVLAEYQSAMAGTKKEAGEVIQKAQEAAAQVLEDARRKSRQESQRELVRARSEIERETEAAKTELRRHVAELTARATTRLIGKTVDPQEHEQLIIDALKEDR
jgi:F-type H+-transporting ATPase subunit b